MGEVLRLVNRSGNAHSAAGAAEQIDQSLALCRGVGFQKILLRGDTKFLAYDAWQPVFFRLLDQFVPAERSRPLRA